MAKIPFSYSNALNPTSKTPANAFYHLLSVPFLQIQQTINSGVYPVTGINSVSNSFGLHSGDTMVYCPNVYIGNVGVMIAGGTGVNDILFAKYIDIEFDKMTVVIDAMNCPDVRIFIACESFAAKR